MLQARYIVLADDSDDDAFFAQRCFGISPHHFELRRCIDGTHVVHLLQHCGPNIPSAVILDIKMPRMDGFEALEWIRRQPKYRDLPVIILSSSGLPQDRERAAQLGATEYLVKPTSLAGLEKLVSELAARLIAAEAVHRAAPQNAARPGRSCESL